MVSVLDSALPGDTTPVSCPTTTDSVPFTPGVVTVTTNEYSVADTVLDSATVTATPPVAVTIKSEAASPVTAKEKVTVNVRDVKCVDAPVARPSADATVVVGGTATV
jgi:hypothetical protein